MNGRKSGHALCMRTGFGYGPMVNLRHNNFRFCQVPSEVKRTKFITVLQKVNEFTQRKEEKEEEKDEEM
jgi:hypothetical protein